MTVVLPSATPGILSGCLLAIARAAGETAPLIFTIGAARRMNLNVFSGTNTALSTQIYANARTTFPVAQDAGVGRHADVHRDFVRVHAAGAGRVGSIGQAAMTATGAPKATRGAMTSMATRTQHTMDDTALPDLAVNIPLVSEAKPSGPLVFDVDDLAVYYGSFKAVREVFLDVHANEVTAFIGPSGCGKSTVLRCFNRMNDTVPGARVEGRITYHGIDLYGRDISATQVRRHIGMVFQKPNPFPKSIYDNVALRPAARRDPRSQRTGRDRRAVAPRRGVVGGGARPLATPPRSGCRAASSNGCASPAPSRSSPK